MFEEKADVHYDVVLFDLPGTMGSDGVIATISALDYLFVPIKADRLVLESTNMEDSVCWTSQSPN